MSVKEEYDAIIRKTT